MKAIGDFLFDLTLVMLALFFLPLFVLRFWVCTYLADGPLADGEELGRFANAAIWFLCVTVTLLVITPYQIGLFLYTAPEYFRAILDAKTDTDSTD